MSPSVAIVTGASRGLGRATALALAESGVQTVLAARGADELRSLTDEISTLGAKSLACVTDISDESAVEHLFATCLNEFGRLDILINNAGVALQRNLVDLTDSDWQRVFDINVRGMFHCSRAAARHFASVGAGRAVNVASVFGLVGRPGYTSYCASKGAVINFTRAAAAEWARFGAQINAVAPGYIATDINAELRGNAEAMKKVLRRIPAHRMGEPEEIANVVRYLALDAPTFLTGQTIVVDGGETSV
ncbi:SDR family NAD(P)-dependent oxidoreductase [Nocardia sp. CA-107356]|uniref:SDR family NAD(P)-dependent oxidoreductase n=1 Tax=Nocardia sp. CA-107356 TaxID=3239972 RepID=UPI003D94A3DD